MLPQLPRLATTPQGPVFDVRVYGAVGASTHDDTAAIQKAIDAQHIVGKGYVLVGGGKTYLISTIVLKDNVTLYLEKGAAIKGVRDAAAYPEMVPKNYYAQKIFKKSMVYAEGAKHVAIAGEGVFDADGKGIKGEETTRWNTIRFVNCEHVHVTGVTFMNSCVWPQLYSRTRHLIVDSVKVKFTDQVNTDGLDIDGCQQVVIRNCRIDSEDDAICLKTLSRDHPIKNVLVYDNVVTSRKANGLKIGTETHGDIEDVTFKNNTVTNCGGRAGGALVVNAVDGGHVSRIVYENIRIDNCYSAIALRLGRRNRRYRNEPNGPKGSAKASTLTKVTLRNIHATNIRRKFECWVSGVPGQRVQDVAFENIAIVSTAAGKVEDRELNPPEKEQAYPDSVMFGTLTAFGLYIRHAENVALKNVSLKCAETEGRRALTLDDVTGKFTLADVRVQKRGIEQRGGTHFPIAENWDEKENMFRLTLKANR